MTIWTLIAFIAGLLLGWLLASYSWRQRVAGYRVQMGGLQTSLDQRETHARELRTRLEGQEAQLDGARGELTRREDTLRLLGSQLEESKQVIARLKTVQEESSDRIRDLESHLEQQRASASGPAAWGEEKQRLLEDCQTELRRLAAELRATGEKLDQREKMDSNLTAQLEERGQVINRLAAKVNHREDQVRSLFARSGAGASPQQRPVSRGAASPQAPADAAGPQPPLRPAFRGDDLSRVEGIGPKISQVLQEAGIWTFALLSMTTVDDLKEILREAGIRLADPTTWPQQARLAAAGEWEALEALQEELTGGRQV